MAWGMECVAEGQEAGSGTLPPHLHFPDKRRGGGGDRPGCGCECRSPSFLPSSRLSRLVFVPVYPSPSPFFLSSGSLQRLLPHIHFSFKQ